MGGTGTFLERGDAWSDAGEAWTVPKKTDENQ
jgi:hypothetical protein